MFYLKMFYQVIWDLKFRGVSFIILTFALFTLAANNELIKKIIEVKQKSQNPYFNALIDKKINSSSIARKLKNLPGVVEVKIKSTGNLKDDLKGMIQDIDSDLIGGILKIDYQGIKVELDGRLEKSSQNLVQEYLNRLVGKENITMTGVKYPALKMIEEQKDFASLFKNWFDSIILICMSIVWCFASWTFSRALLNKSYLIEKFQRKKMVALKSFVLGMLSIAFLILNIIYFYGGDSVNLLLFFIPLFLVGMTFNTNQIRFVNQK